MEPKNNGLQQLNKSGSYLVLQDTNENRRQQTFVTPWQCGGPRSINPLFVPVNTRSAPQDEARLTGQNLLHEYGHDVIEV
jgi:hypothetical protein